MTKPELYNFIAAQKLGVLGSISPDDTPQAALVGIAVTQDLEIIFDTVGSSREYRNLTANPRASFVIGWTGEVTLQLEGEAFLPQGDALVRYKNVYFAKWPDGPGRQSWPGISYFVVRPIWIRYSDCDRNPPFIEEFTF